MYDKNNGLDTEARARTATPSNSLYRDGKGGLSLWDRTKFPYREDPKTGMPVPLAEGEYFRVRFNDDILLVEYKRKCWWWKDEYLAGSSIRVSDAEVLVPDDILWVALNALEEWESLKEDLIGFDKALSEQEEYRKKMLKARKANSRFAGKYPPKVLK